MAIARGAGVALSAAMRASSTCVPGVFRGLGVSSSSADVDLSPLLVFSAVPFVPDFFFAVFDFGVGVWRRFTFGVADLFGFGVGATCDLVFSD